METNILQEAAHYPSKGKRSTIKPSSQGAIVIIEGIRFSTEVPINETHAELINKTIKEL